MTTEKIRKPKLAVWKFTSCDGCQLTLLDCEDELTSLMSEIDLAYFPEATKAQMKGPFDLSLVEGSISTPLEAERIRQVRQASKYLVTIGACASAGGLQALRNFKDVKKFIKIVYPVPSKVDTLELSTPVSEHVSVDLELRGCPVSQTALIGAIKAYLFNGPIPQTLNRSVCVDCKKRGLPCLMLTQNKPCMGPLTQTGCDALCPSYNRVCVGCYGPKEHAHPEALIKHWRQLGVSDPEIKRTFRGLNAYAEPFRKELVTSEK